VFEGCRDERNFTSKCTPSDDAAYAMFIIGNLFIATGAAPLFTVGQAYLDEIVRPKYLPIHIGLYHAMAVVGPAFGYAVGSSVLSIYVDPWIDTTLVTTDPAWVGAWWLSFVLAGVMAMILSIPFLMFPRYLPDSHVVRKERAEEMAKIYSSKYANEDNLTITVKMFPVHIKRLLFNLSFMFASFGLAILFIMISGLVSFAPKYVEIQFQLTATFAGLLAGGVGIVSATCGVFLGALILFFTKMKGRKVMLFTFVLITVMILFNPSFLIHCPSPQIVGVTTPFHNDRYVDIILTTNIIIIYYNLIIIISIFDNNVHTLFF
jgi:organic anion transporter 4A